MRAEVITITSGKGGVGKTTLTANLSAALAMLGRKVVALDADIGLRNLDVVMGLENRIVYDLVDVIEGRCRLRQAMIKDKRFSDLHIIAAAQTRDKSAVTPENFVEICDHLRKEMDYILVDSPAGIERGFRNAIAPADRIIIVTNPEHAAVRDADRIIGLIEAKGKGPAQLVINRLNPDMVDRGNLLSTEDVLDILAIELLGVVPEDETILISSNRGTLAAIQGTNGTSASQAFHNIAFRLTGQNVAQMDFRYQTYPNDNPAILDSRNGPIYRDEYSAQQRRGLDNGRNHWTVDFERDRLRESSPELRGGIRRTGNQTYEDGYYRQSLTRPEQFPPPPRPPPLSALFLKETVRSGRSIYHEGSVIVVGDVNPSAEIIAAGDVIVWGKVRGMIHAGAWGNAAAVICALDLSPTQLRIADHIAIPPEARTGPIIPEIVAIREGQIIAEPWWK